MGLYFRWEDGKLAFCDPAAGLPIATLENELTRADHAEVNRNAEIARANNAEARVWELEERLGHHGS